MRFSGEEHCEGKKVSAERVWEIYCKLLIRFQTFRCPGQLNPVMEIKPTRRGCAYYAPLPGFVIPAHILDTCEEYVIFYISHELSHHAYGRIQHGPEMCKVERDMLAPFDIFIHYRGGFGKNQPWYPRALTRSTGRVICEVVRENRRTVVKIKS